MADTSPLVYVADHTVAGAATGADSERNVVVCPFAGSVSSVQYVPDTVLTGADTNSRTVVLVNKKGDASGTTVIATKAFTSGVNAPADRSTAITLSATAADLVVAAGDVLAWQSTHVGTGLADPGGLGHIEITRS